jgi:hypothetical protein
MFWQRARSQQQRGEKIMAGSGKAKEISLGNDLGEVAVKVNGVRLEVHPDGSILVKTNGTVDAFTNADVTIWRAANEHGKLTPRVIWAEPTPGDKMSDGTIYAGISPDTGKAMYAAPKDAPLTYTFDRAKEYAAKLDAHGHRDWGVPTKAELNVLWENRNRGKLAGTFNETGSLSAGWYRSSSQTNHLLAWSQRFSDRTLSNHSQLYNSSLRCVRFG